MVDYMGCKDLEFGSQDLSAVIFSQHLRLSKWVKVMPGNHYRCKILKLSAYLCTHADLVIFRFVYGLHGVERSSRRWVTLPARLTCVPGVGRSCSEEMKRMLFAGYLPSLAIW